MTILECMLQWAESVGIQVNTDGNNLLFPVDGENGSWLARVSALEEDGLLFIVTAYPFHVVGDARLDAAIALAEITSQLKLGAFYIDQANGQINFRLGQKIPSGEVRLQWVADWIMTAMSVTDGYYRKMMALAAEE